ncbi:MAG: cytochrome c oxidase assembly protein [Tistlia sp.]|uniref:cytochrome c oxidase assembly protein n=1 Tax=Tistlia sp. TaxID=3057121 RepID=UPI0034A28764
MERALQRRRGARPPGRGGLAGAAMLLAATLLSLALVPLADRTLAAAGAGHLTRHMTVHLALMGLAAPLLAFLLLRQLRLPGRALALVGSLTLASTLQVVLLWGWHLPGLLEPVLARPALHLLMQGSLLLGATWFWLAILSCRGAGRWRSILALLITGKLFCLLGVLLVFAPRALYAFGQGHLAPALADQQLAGLLMLTFCPLTYVAAGVAVAARWLSDLGAAPAALSAAPADRARQGWRRG